MKRQLEATGLTTEQTEISEEALVESIQVQRNSLGFILTFNWNAGSIALPTQTTALLKGSPAIGKAPKPSAPKCDQRGRKRDQKPDIGAFER